MFFIKKLEHQILLHPQFFGCNLGDHIKKRIHHEVEGTCSGRYGYVVSVPLIDSIGAGCVIEGTGMARFDVTYTALVMKPFRNEVIDAIVSVVNNMGFFAMAGPLNIFVSTHHIPEEFVFQPQANPPCYQSNDESVKIEKGERVRLKIIGVRNDAKEIFTIATIKEDYLY